MRKYFLFALIVLTVLVSACAQCSQKSAPPPPPPAPLMTEIVAMPGINTNQLSYPQRESLSKILKDEMCPCGQALSFAQCLAESAQCKPAQLLAQWLADRLADGIAVNLLAEVTTKEISGGYSSQFESIDLAGYAHRGSANAKIRIVEFADFECVHCRAATKNLHAFAEKYPNEIAVYFKHFPLPNHLMALDAAYAAEAAALQGKFWQMHDALFENQVNLKADLILSLAKQLKLNIKKFQQDLVSSKVKEKVAQSLAEGRKLGLQATPSFYFNNRPYNLSFDLSGFELRRKMELLRPNTKSNNSKIGGVRDRQGSNLPANAIVGST